MRIALICTTMLVLTACGKENTQTSITEPVQVSAPAAGEITPSPAKANNATLPFGLPAMPGARVLHSGKFYDTRSRGKEAIASFVVKATPLEVAAFYEQALREHGFIPKLGRNNDAVLASVYGERENGEKFSVTTSRSGSKAEPGESQSGVVASAPN